MSFFRLSLMFLLLAGTCGYGREVIVSLWISGGAEGILDGGRVAPGWLGLLSKLGDRPENEPWIDVGGTRHLQRLSGMKEVRIPEAVIPGESLLRLQGFSFFNRTKQPWVITNAAMLPQFPEQKLPVATEWVWTHPDGGRIRVLGGLCEKAPLRIPADRLRPLHVLPAVETFRESYLNRAKPGALEVLVVPEHVDPKEWSRLFPDADIVVEPPTGAAKQVELSNGSRVRVRPARFGRAVIRVWAKWDTVAKTFSDPKAEAVWVSPCDYTKVEVPAGLAAEIRSLQSVSLENVAEVVWSPRLESMEVSTVRPDGIRAQRVPEDDAWMIAAQVPASRWRQWADVEGAQWQRTGDSLSRSPTVALPATVAAGRGRWECPIRQDLLNGAVQAEWLDVTTRSFLQKEEESP